GGGAVEGEEGLEGVVFGRGRERLERSGGAGDVERAVGGVVEVLGQQGRRAFVSHGRERIGERSHRRRGEGVRQEVVVLLQRLQHVLGAGAALGDQGGGAARERHGGVRVGGHVDERLGGERIGRGRERSEERRVGKGWSVRQWT